MSGPLSDALGVSPGDVVAVAGCGGKTTLVLRLAGEWRERRVLVAPTARIGRRQLDSCDFLYTSPAQWNAPSPLPGVHGAGVEAAEGRKLAALPEEVLERLHRGFDLTILEADGSRGLPLKGWRPDEPVIPPFVTRTVGVAVLWAAGRPLDEEIAFQPELFGRISGAALGEAVAPAHMAAAIAHPAGLFQNAKGRRVLFLNQVEDETGLQATRALTAQLPEAFRASLERVVAGSLHTGRFEILYKGCFQHE